jgi:hypothetical protein
MLVLKKNHTRCNIIEKMERMLSVWIDDMGRHMPVSQMTIQNKALNLFKFLKNQQEEEINENVMASRGWLETFKKRSNTHSIRITGKIASADVQAVTEFPEQIRTIIERG